MRMLATIAFVLLALALVCLPLSAEPDQSPRGGISKAPVPFPDWAESGSSYLNQVINGAGAQLADLKGTLNFEMRNLEKMAASAKPIMLAIHRQLYGYNVLTGRLRKDLDRATTIYEIDQIMREAEKARVAISNLKTVLQVRMTYVEGFLAALEKSSGERAALIQSLRGTLQSPELTKGVDLSWQRYVSGWVDHVRETLEDCEALRVTVKNERAPFLNGGFYDDIACVTGKKVAALHAAVDNVTRFADERRKVVSASAKLSLEITAAMLAGQKLRDSLLRVREEAKASALLVKNGVASLIKEVKDSAAPDRQLIKQLTQMRRSASSSRCVSLNFSPRLRASLASKSSSRFSAPRNSSFPGPVSWPCATPHVQRQTNASTATTNLGFIDLRLFRFVTRTTPRHSPPNAAHSQLGGLALPRIVPSCAGCARK